MGRREHFISIKPFFGIAVAATIAVIVIPIFAVFSLLSAFDPDPPAFVSAILGVALAIAVMVIGNVLWSRRSESHDIGFSELMLWRWLRRHKAEEDLAHGARLLGLDRSGQPIDDVRISAEEQLQVLKDLTAALESKDPYTHGHSQRVERHVYRTAAAMGLSAEDIEDLRKAAALHDVGKIRVPDRILRKAGPLEDEERLVVEEHSVVGAWMVSSVGNADVIAAVRHHHERWDGAGYPDGLSGSDVPLFARVIAVADAYDAITSTRPYRASSGREDAITALRAGAGAQFDPEIVETFVESLPSRLPLAAGLFVILGGPGRIVREISMWFRRLGATNLAPAAGATGAAIVLGASIFTPNIIDERASFTRTVAVEEDDGDEVLDSRIERPEKEEKEQPEKEKAPKGDRKAARDTEDRKVKAAKDKDTAPAAAPEEPKDPQSPPDHTSPPPPSPTDPNTPTPTGSPTQPDDTDGNPNDGRDDCDDDGDAGKGNDDKKC